MRLGAGTFLRSRMRRPTPWSLRELSTPPRLDRHIVLHYRDPLLLDPNAGLNRTDSDVTAAAYFMGRRSDIRPADGAEFHTLLEVNHLTTLSIKRAFACCVLEWYPPGHPPPDLDIPSECPFCGCVRQLSGFWDPMESGTARVLPQVPLPRFWEPAGAAFHFILFHFIFYLFIISFDFISFYYLSIYYFSLFYFILFQMCCASGQPCLTPCCRQTSPHPSRRWCTSNTPRCALGAGPHHLAGLQHITAACGTPG